MYVNSRKLSNLTSYKTIIANGVHILALPNIRHRPGPSSTNITVLLSVCDSIRKRSVFYGSSKNINYDRMTPDKSTTCTFSRLTFSRYFPHNYKNTETWRQHFLHGRRALSSSVNSVYNLNCKFPGQLRGATFIADNNIPIQIY